MTREEWLLAAGDMLCAGLLAPLQLQPRTTVHYSCGFPKSKKAIGECWHEDASDDKSINIFVSACQADSMRVLDILLHELVHACLPVGEKHGKKFKQAVTALGLHGKATATFAAEGSPLYATLQGYVEKLGPYPHAAIKRRGKEKGEDDKEKVSWKRAYSVSNPEYVINVRMDVIAEHGLPLDPWGEQMTFEKGE